MLYYYKEPVFWYKEVCIYRKFLKSKFCLVINLCEGYSFYIFSYFFKILQTLQVYGMWASADLYLIIV